MNKPVGLTKNVGFEFGLRRTVPFPAEQVWKFLMSQDGLGIWLGESVDFKPEKGAEYHTKEGINGIVRVFNPGINIRLAWHPIDWPRESVLQVRVIPREKKATISFHQENIPDARYREEMGERWKSVMVVLENALLAR